MSSVNRSKSGQQGQFSFGWKKRGSEIEFALGILGSLMLIAGTLIDEIGLPHSGYHIHAFYDCDYSTLFSFSYLFAHDSSYLFKRAGIEDGFILISVALVGLYLTLTGRFKYLWGPGLVSVVLLAISVVRLHDRYWIWKSEESHKDPVGPPPGWLGYPDDWGLLVMVTGCILMIGAGAIATFKYVSERQQQSRSNGTV